MAQTAVTMQPLRSSEALKEATPAFQPVLHQNGYNENKEYERKDPTDPEPLTEVTAVHDSGDSHQEERDNKRRQSEPTNCCCVYLGDSDPFGIYILCECICSCFRGIGTCTENCFEGCADCLSNCCEENPGDSSPDECGCCDGDCLSCLECCTCDD